MSPTKLLVLCVLLATSAVPARAQSRGASWTTTSSAGASVLSTSYTMTSTAPSYLTTSYASAGSSYATTSAAASPLSTGAYTTSAGASSVSTGVTGILSNGQVVTQLARMVNRHGARVTGMYEAPRSDGGRTITIYFEVPEASASPRRATLVVTTDAYGTVDRVGSPAADL